MRSSLVCSVIAASCLYSQVATAFTPSRNLGVGSTIAPSPIVTFMAESDVDSNEIIGRRIVVTGDVNAGYVRTCVVNEASRFRRLIGTMSPPDDEQDTAEIYVEGKRKMVEGFIRWCEKGTKNIGLSQKLEVKEVQEEIPTGLFDGFYAKSH
uniref:Acylphosphatase-like domain-containing protein n=1 Tax=Trieres chinensis TaxID=1514140 RepID=A0A7S1Z798_TRICV|mmetsp:Transcript_19270/g.39073  ORF Transcript_19270/g.39073 Transcript_19270/m.39073 type:complete len:152 (+) Transcript_19270:140-595(+)